MAKQGKLYGLGVGPGAPDLITVRAVNILSTVDLIYAPKSGPDKPSQALAIVRPYLQEDCQVKEVHFPMTNDQAAKQAAWRAIADQIQDDLDNGQQAAFLTMGDPSTYATYSYVLAYLRPDTEVETVAGITSYQQMAAQENFPLALDRDSLTVVPANAGRDQLVRAFDTSQVVVVMKVSLNLGTVLALLDERKLRDRALIISEVSMSDQRVYRNLSSWKGDEDLPYFSTMIVAQSERGLASSWEEENR